MTRKQRPLIKIFLIALACAALFGLACLHDGAASLRGGTGPVARVTERVHQFGELSPWEMVEHTFTLRNDGDGVLRIERVSPD